MASRPVVLGDDELIADGLVVDVVTPRRDVFDEFVRLAADPSDAAILAYAQRYGMLGLRLCDQATAGFVRPDLPWVGEELARSIGYQLAPGFLCEPLGLWRRILREIRAASTIAARLRNDELVVCGAWDPLQRIVQLPLGPDGLVRLDPGVGERELAAGTDAPFILATPTTLDGQREALAAVIGAWLAIGAVRPALTWGGPGRPAEPAMALGVTTLFGGLVLELLLSIAGKVGVALCSGCGVPYVPDRRLPSARFGEVPRRYCADCRDKHAAQNAASKRWRDKNPGYASKRRAKLAALDPAPKGEPPEQS